MGFITAVPANMAVYDDVVQMVEINFLCVHKKLRYVSNLFLFLFLFFMTSLNCLLFHAKTVGLVGDVYRTNRLAPVLIKEITRRVNLENIWQATYTAGVVLPKPVGRCRYHHRSLNPKKLIEVTQCLYSIFDAF